ncbi:MAG: hypothetical protein A3J29_03755 [Acidobacteria bacterium RIFCSPLOWO2_12_FULL_67_14b]|nr:MAG: hypothetical protein A3J29_03755 [Acidobacteria bacterium RIFCSPLOWO2_12_FULL_67_14b]
MFDDDPRWGNDPRERNDDSRDRDAVDPRDVFVQELDLPRGPERELVSEHIAGAMSHAFARFG